MGFQRLLKSLLPQRGAGILLVINITNSLIHKLCIIFEVEKNIYEANLLQNSFQCGPW